MKQVTLYWDNGSNSVWYKNNQSVWRILNCNGWVNAKHQDWTGDEFQKSLTVNNFKENYMKHVHADLMMKYAEIAQRDPKPWTYFQVSDDSVKWFNCVQEVQFLSKNNYRLKPRTINVNGFEVPEPIRQMSVGNIYYIVKTPFVEGITCNSEPYETQLISSGVVHLTRENAEKHLEALLSFTKE